MGADASDASSEWSGSTPGEPAGTALDDLARWQPLLDAVVSMAADLTLDELLSRIVKIAADLADARYAALGVIG
jgi:hypothetical protein